MDNFNITVGNGPDDDERPYYIEVKIVDDCGEFEDGVRGRFSPEPRTIKIDEDGNEMKQELEKIGELQLLREEIGVGYVTHEMFHALSRYMQLFDYNDFHNEHSIGEEILAWEFGEWKRQFWIKFDEGDA